MANIMELANKNMHYTWVRRNDYMQSLIRRSSAQGKRGLQIGVIHGAESNFGPNWESLDLYDKRPCITHHADLADTKLPSGVYDYIVCNAVLEHVKNPFACAAEMTRVAKVGCELYVEVPFFQPFHPVKEWDERMGMFLDGTEGLDLPEDYNHGGDYWRFTPMSLAMLFSAFKKDRQVEIFEDGGLSYLGTKE